MNYKKNPIENEEYNSKFKQEENQHENEMNLYTITKMGHNDDDKTKNIGSNHVTVVKRLLNDQ